MKIKRFAARDLAAATNMIKEEFGLAALILSQRELPPEEGPGVEITAGVRDEDLPPAKAAEESLPAPAAAPRARAGPAAGVAAYRQAGLAAAQHSPVSSRDLEALEKTLGKEIGQLKELILDLAHRQSLAEKWRDRPDLVRLYRRLLDTGLRPEHARALMETAAESAKAWGGQLEEHLRRAMRPKLRIVDLSLAPPRRLALVGPSGSGKTTALVNLAAFYRQRGRSVAAVTLDTLRLGAAEQLTQYARILGLGVRVCQNHQEFKEALEIFETEDLLLIDTAGRAFLKDEGRRELNVYFNEAQASALLVLSAAMKEADLAAALNRARTFRESGLVIAKFDETESLGGLAGFIISAAPRLAFFSLGPRASEDFTLASPDKFLSLWLGESPAPDKNGENSEKA
ncbi:MAG: flagellar biosynthesis protein FlhF [Candidatus Adiutrix sp.]|jgi:flagellar biosynthesis protein FlhF|nr:flagellar biosynthesis protein FlhF [Candidatus Adiutrix sp.]